MLILLTMVTGGSVETGCTRCTRYLIYEHHVTPLSPDMERIKGTSRCRVIAAQITASKPSNNNMYWLTLALVLLTLLAFRLLSNLLHNIRLARSTNLPYYIFPVSEVNILWLGLLETRTFQNLVKNWFPTILADYVYDSGFKFRWTVKDRLKRKYGGAYLIVTPGTVSCQVGDAGIIAQVCRQRQRFPKPSHQYGGFSCLWILCAFG